MNELRVCVDKTLPLDKLPEAHEAALRERLGNAPDSSAFADLQRVVGSITRGPAFFGQPEIATAVLLSSKKWQPGRTIKVGWFGGPYNEDDELRERIRYHANALERYMNLNFRFIGFRNVQEADLRISDERNGSWSYVGTDNLLIPKNEPTMNFGWLTRDSSHEEIRRVVKHEFLHAAGLGHEHQNPRGGLPWNEAAVYDYYTRTQGWSREDVYYQVLRRYSENMVVATERDPKSLMHYPVPAQLLTDPSKAVGWNDDISAGDKAFLRSVYPYPGEEAA